MKAQQGLRQRARTTGATVKSTGHGHDYLVQAAANDGVLEEGHFATYSSVLLFARLLSDRLSGIQEAVSREIGLSGNQYLILLALACDRGSDGMTVREIADFTHMQSTHVTTQAGLLVNRGLIRKQPNSNDGRSVLVSLTSKGKKAMDLLAPVHQELNHVFSVGVSSKAMLVAGNFLDQTLANSQTAMQTLDRAKVKVGIENKIDRSRLSPRVSNEAAFV